MRDKKFIEKIKLELQKGIKFVKCRKCGCMQETLKTLHNFFSEAAKESSTFVGSIKSWLTKIQPIEYSCLGCRHCYPATAMNIFNQAFPKVMRTTALCDFKVDQRKWPSVPGEYFAFCEGSGCPVAVSTLASVGLSQRLARERPDGLCIVGKTETENIGIDKIIKNVITNSTIQFLLLVGKDSKGHESGKTLFALWRNGVDRNMRVIGSPGRLPVLKNVTHKEVETFRKQVEVINMIGCEDIKKIFDKIDELSKSTVSVRNGRKPRWTKSIQIRSPSRIQAQKAQKTKFDKTGYFVIIPSGKKNIIVEHYSYDNKLLHTLEGENISDIYSTVIEKGWISDLSHAAYLGKELAKAELSLKYGFRYIQDRAWNEV